MYGSNVQFLQSILVLLLPSFDNFAVFLDKATGSFWHLLLYLQFCWWQCLSLLFLCYHDNSFSFIFKSFNFSHCKSNLEGGILQYHERVCVCVSTHWSYKAAVIIKTRSRPSKINLFIPGLSWSCGTGFQERREWISEAVGVVGSLSLLQWNNGKGIYQPQEAFTALSFCLLADMSWQGLFSPSSHPLQLKPSGFSASSE